MSDPGEEHFRPLLDWLTTAARRLEDATVECELSTTGRSAFVDIFVRCGAARMTLNAEGHLDSEVITDKSEMVFFSHRDDAISVSVLSSELDALLPHLSLLR